MKLVFPKKGKKQIASLLLKTVSSFPDYLDIERKLYGLSDLEKYSYELSNKSFYFESTSDTIILRQIEKRLLNYIRE